VVPTITASRGTVVKKMGDAILAVFKHPVNAVVAAMTVQQKIISYSSMQMEQDKFHVRIGLDTGEVTWKDTDVFGNTVNRASRMQTTAQKDGIQLTEDTWKQIREYVRCTKLGTINAKGIGDVTAYQPEGLLVDLEKVRATGGTERSPVQAGSLERLRESMFVPEFRVPEERAGRPGVDLLREMFVEIAQSVGDLLPDSQEYDFKKYLQERWNDLMRRL
jgi:hypothetical protein